MDRTYLNQLNRKLSDALGTSQAGGPMFQWMHAKDLMVRQMESGVCVDVPQLDEVSTQDGTNPMVPAPRWVIATWQPPHYTLERYRAVFGDSMPYPRNGRYVVTDIVLRRGEEPNERVTDNVIGNEKARRYLVDRQRADTMRDRAVRAQEEAGREAADIVASAFPAFDHVPGAKDHVSFGGI